MAVKIIAHRGANHQAPQNTLPAFETAFAMQTDGIETDVHLTADGVPVICHNYEIDETSNGRGSISKMTLETFKSYDFGTHFGEAFKDTPAPTLEELLALCASQTFEILNIELKPSRENDVSVVAKTIDMVKQFGLFDRLLISSFSTHMLTEAKKVDRFCRTALLYSPNRKEFFRLMGREDAFGKALGVSALHPEVPGHTAACAEGARGRHSRERVDSQRAERAAQIRKNGRGRADHRRAGRSAAHPDGRRTADNRIKTKRRTAVVPSSCTDVANARICLCNPILPRPAKNMQTFF